MKLISLKNIPKSLPQKSIQHFTKATVTVVGRHGNTATTTIELHMTGPRALLDKQCLYTQMWLCMISQYCDLIYLSMTMRVDIL